MTLQRGLALRIWLTLRILLTWLRVLLALLLICSTLLVLLPALVGTRLRVLLSASIRLSRRCLLSRPVRLSGGRLLSSGPVGLSGRCRLSGSIGLALPPRLLKLLTLPPGLLPLPPWCVRRALLWAGRTLQAWLLLVAPLVDQLLAGALRRKSLLHEGAIARGFLW